MRVLWNAWGLRKWATTCSESIGPHQLNCSVSLSAKWGCLTTCYGVLLEAVAAGTFLILCRQTLWVFVSTVASPGIVLLLCVNSPPLCPLIPPIVVAYYLQNTAGPNHSPTLNMGRSTKHGGHGKNGLWKCWWGAPLRSARFPISASENVWTFFNNFTAEASATDMSDVWIQRDGWLGASQDGDVLGMQSSWKFLLTSPFCLPFSLWIWTPATSALATV